MGIVGGYLLYLAYQLFEGRNDPETTMTPGIMILFITLFVISGAVLLVYAIRLWKNSADGEKTERETGDDGNSLK